MGKEDGVLIVVQTWKRPDYLDLIVGQVRQFTKTKYELVVSTASEDTEAIRYCEENDITCFHSPDRGCGRARNQGYWYFWEHTEYDVIITLEDDCRLWEVGWEEEWIAAANRWGMICYAYNNKQNSTGGNRWDDPIWTTEFGFHATAMNRGAMSLVGFSNPIYTGYGYDDTDLAHRYYRALRAEGSWQGKPLKCHPCLNAHIGVLFDVSHFNPETFRQNEKIYLSQKKQLVDQPIGHWYPWISPKDREIFLNGIRPHIPKSNINKPGKCIVCGGNGREIGRKNGYPLRSCHGVTMSFPYNSEEEYQKIYTEGDYHSGFQEKEGQPDYWDRDEDLLKASVSRMEILKAMGISSGTLLDIGAGTGALVQAAKDAGFRAIGLEPSKETAEEAFRKGRQVAEGSAYDITSKQRYDVIYMSDVFEHLTSPRKCLDGVWSALKDDGMLVIEMPEEGCPQAQQQGMSWRHYRPLQHVYLYTEGAARSLFEQKGFYVEAVTRPLRGSIGKIVYYLRKIVKTT